jgi:hypothetical protein
MVRKEDFFRTALEGQKKLGRPVPIVPFADWDYYYIKDTLYWKNDRKIPDLPPSVHVPEGFATDLTSVPRIFWSLLPPAGVYAYPAIIHDFLYWFQTCTRLQADNVLWYAMEDLEIPKLKMLLIYKAVRFGGEIAWEQNKKARASGERRILIDFPTDMKTTWNVWRSHGEAFAAE